MLTLKDIYAFIAIGLMLCSRGTYFTSMMKGRTRPHAFSWLIWGVISAIGLAAQIAEHAGPAAWVRGVGCATCYLILGFCWWKGERDIKRADWITLIVAFAGIPLWVITKTPVWSVVLVCLIDCSAYLPTARKVWRKPREETPYSYMFSCCGAFLSLLAIENYTPSTYLYPAVLTASNCLMASYILFRRWQLHPKRAKAGLGLGDEASSLHWQ
jgi:hypothetical protein